LGHHIAANSADLTLRLSSRRFHERKFDPKSGQQKPSKTIFFNGLLFGCGTGFEPVTFRL
jgi:hypothetical protein